MPTIPDSVDLRILRELQRDGRLQNVELASRVGLSPSPCLRRVRLLEEAGVIAGYAALVDGASVGFNLVLFARITLVAQDAETVDRFSKAMIRLSQVVECHIMAGECDALLRIVARDLDHYRRFQSAHLTRANAVQNVRTEIPMQRVKFTTELPV